MLPLPINARRHQQKQRESPCLHFKVSRKASTSCICSSVYLESRLSCAARGSCTSTVTFSRENERGHPEASCSDTVNSSRWSSAPETCSPLARCTVTLGGAGGVTAFPMKTSIRFGAGYSIRRCNSAASYLLATCAKSPVGE